MPKGESDEYKTEVRLPFQKLQEEKNQNDTVDPKDAQGIVVLDCFAGIGTSVVALKRLGIKIKTVIHVEKDRVATHVFRWNHDSSYNEKVDDDGIHHVYKESFELVSNEDDDDRFKRLWEWVRTSVSSSTSS